MATLGRLRVTRAGILFIVGVLILGILVTGAIFLVKNRGEAVRRDQAIQIAEQNLKDQSAATSAADTDDEGADVPPSDSTDTATDTTTVATTTPAETELPQTGPESAGNIAIVAILALSIAFYVASRRATHQG